MIAWAHGPAERAVATVRDSGVVRVHEDPMTETLPLYLAYYERLRSLDRHGAQALVDDYLAQTNDIDSLYDQVLMPAMVHAGQEWELDRISVAHEHYISEVTREVIRRIGSRQWTPTDGPVAVACGTPGERHVIGLMMVCDILRGEGFHVHTLGEGAPVEAIRDFVVEVRADLLGLSCALTEHLPAAAELIAAIRGARPETTILLGGRAFEGDAERARTIGADSFANDIRDVRRILPGILRRHAR